MMFETSFREKVALVTGGTGGIGSEIVRRLAQHGANIAICYSSQTSKADALAREIEKCGVIAHTLKIDQRDESSIRSAIDNCERKFGRLDIVVNNAAWNKGIPFSETQAMTSELWDKMMEINLRGPFLIAREAAELLRRDGGGHIVNISSNGGIAPTSSSIAYSVSKAGLLHLTRCLAVALAPDIAVNAIAPGVVSGTRMADRMPNDVRDSETKSSVLGRNATAKDIALQLVCICQSRSISGQTIAIDGGMPIAMR